MRCPVWCSVGGVGLLMIAISLYYGFSQKNMDDPKIPISTEEVCHHYEDDFKSRPHASSEGSAKSTGVLQRFIKKIGYFFKDLEQRAVMNRALDISQGPLGHVFLENCCQCQPSQMNSKKTIMVKGMSIDIASDHNMMGSYQVNEREQCVMFPHSSWMLSKKELMNLCYVCKGQSHRNRSVECTTCIKKHRYQHGQLSKYRSRFSNPNY